LRERTQTRKAELGSHAEPLEGERGKQERNPNTTIHHYGASISRRRDGRSVHRLSSMENMKALLPAKGHWSFLPLLFGRNTGMQPSKQK